MPTVGKSISDRASRIAFLADFCLASRSETSKLEFPVPKSETCGISDSKILDLLATLRDSIQRGVCDLLTCTEAARQSPVVCIFVGDVG